VTRLLALALALLLPVLAVADGDFTNNSTVAADVDRVVFAVTTAHRITGAHTVSTTWRGTSATTQSALSSRSIVGANQNYLLTLLSTSVASAAASSAGVAEGAYLATATSATGHDGARHHAAVVFSGASTTAVIYYDGVAEATDSVVLATDDPDFGVAIGARGASATTYGTGSDSLVVQGEARIYNVPLTAGEVTQLSAVNSMRKPFRGQVLYCQMLGVPGAAFGGADTVVDWSPTKVHGDGDDGNPDPTYAVRMARGAGR